jgi:hypothetical protein
MLKALSIAFSGGLVLAFCVVTLAAPSQQSDRPGIVMQPRVMIDNRDPNDAIPVWIRQSSDDAAVKAQIVGTPTILVSPEGVVQARLVSQPWAYRTIRVAPGQDVPTSLAGAGTDGWEVIGSQIDTTGGISFLLKRPIERR